MKNLRNLALIISFSGLNYHGWQIQKNAVSVQEVFQKALFKALGEKVDIKGCSRTDTGVHANMYCVSFKTYSKIMCDNLVFAINKFLPKDIAVISCKEVPSDFHARYSCIGKEYIYKIFNRKIRSPFLEGYALHYWYPIDENLLNEAAQEFIGTHDFTSFATLDSRDTSDMSRNISRFEVKRIGDTIELSVSADGFLYNMVRIMVGTLLFVQQGKIKKEDIKKIISAKDRKLAGPTAIPSGLYLNKVIYSKEDLS